VNVKMGISRNLVTTARVIMIRQPSAKENAKCAKTVYKAAQDVLMDAIVMGRLR